VLSAGESVLLSLPNYMTGNANKSLAGLLQHYSVKLMTVAVAGSLYDRDDPRKELG
jgi:hypothetical protein